jgi:hypothetical protein
MNPILLSTPSVGSLVKKVITINPDLTAQEVMDLIRASVEFRGGLIGEPSRFEAVNEQKALQLAHATLATTAATLSPPTHS